MHGITFGLLSCFPRLLSFSSTIVSLAYLKSFSFRKRIFIKSVYVVTVKHQLKNCIMYYERQVVEW